MSATSGLQAPARPSAVPVGYRLLAGGRGDLASRLGRFPPRPAEKTWAVTRQPREQLPDRLLSAPFRMENTQSQANRKAGMTQLLDWLETQPGGTWQERWAASGAEEAGDWRALPARWLKDGNRIRDDHGPEVSRPGKDGTVSSSERRHPRGASPAGAPGSVRTSLARGQLTAGQLIDRYDIACRPVRDLLADYLKERQPSVDYATLRNLAQRLGS